MSLGLLALLALLALLVLLEAVEERGAHLRELSGRRRGCPEESSRFPPAPAALLAKGDGAGAKLPTDLPAASSVSAALGAPPLAPLAVAVAVAVAVAADFTGNVAAGAKICAAPLKIPVDDSSTTPSQRSKVEDAASLWCCCCTSAVAANAAEGGLPGEMAIGTAPS